MKENLSERVREVALQVFGSGDKELTEDTSFKNDLGADSLDLLEFAMALGEEFGFEVPDEDINPDKLGTVREVVTYLEEHLNKDL